MKLQNYLDIDDIHHLLSSRYTVEKMPIKHYLRCYRGRNTKPALKKKRLNVHFTLVYPK